MTPSKLTDEKIQENLFALQRVPSGLVDLQVLLDSLQELLERRREDVTTRGLERTFAYDHASWLIECSSVHPSRNGEEDLDSFDLASAKCDNGDLIEGVEGAVRYLDSRGLIERDPEHPDWISIRDEGEANDILNLSPTVEGPR